MSTVVYDPHSMHMNLEELGKAFDALPDYPQKDFDFQLMALIGEYMNGRGVAFPGMRTLAARLHCFKMDVKRGVDRLLKFGFLAVRKVKSKGARWEHNVYIFAKRFLRKTVDKLAHHFDAQKWKTWVEEKLSDRQRRKLVRRYCEQTDTDLENAGVYTGHWMAMRYVKTHVGETPAEYEAILAEAIAKYRDYEGPNYREIADRPVKSVEPVPAPVMEKPMKPGMEPANGLAMKAVEPAMGSNVSEEPWLEADDTVEWECVSEEDTAKMFRVFDAHPELVNNPEEAAEMAGVVFPDMKTEEAAAPVEEAAPEIMKRETSLETMSANTANMQNVPRFINGEVSSLWTSQQLLHKMNPDTYPAY